MNHYSILDKNMKDQNIIDIDFTNQNLSDVDFTGSYIIADFTGANLKRTKFCGGKISKKSFETMEMKPKYRHRFMITVHIVDDEELLREEMNRGVDDIPKIPPILLRTDTLILH